MQRIFNVTCAACQKHFPVDYALRYADVTLECPNCRNKFAVDEAAKIDDRWNN